MIPLMEIRRFPLASLYMFLGGVFKAQEFQHRDIEVGEENREVYFKIFRIP